MFKPLLKGTAAFWDYDNALEADNGVLALPNSNKVT